VDFAVFLRRLGKNLRTARWLKGLTQQDVASMGITYRYYQELERGGRNPTLRTLCELGQVLGGRVADLVDVGERAAAVDLSEVEATPPPRGRKPAKKPRKPSTGPHRRLPRR
jgi:transcriptional regulator with XRE-family HTH domain